MLPGAGSRTGWQGWRCGRAGCRCSGPRATHACLCPGGMELGLEIEVGPLAAVGEVFFRWNGPCQQIGLYYTVNFPGKPWEGLRYSLDSSEKVGFLWVPVEKIQRGEAEFCLPKLAERLGKPGVAHFVDNQLK